MSRWRMVVGMLLAAGLSGGTGLAQNSLPPAKGKGKGDQPAPAPQLEKIAWLAGSWRMEKAGRVVEEQWLAPAAGLMLGLSRTVAKARVTEFEFMQIREGPGGALFFVAQPSGQKEAAFQMASLSDSEIVFENPEHDFPQRITYTHLAEDSVLAAIEGAPGADGKRRRVEFTYKRVQP